MKSLISKCFLRVFILKYRLFMIALVAARLSFAAFFNKSSKLDFFSCTLRRRPSAFDPAGAGGGLAWEGTLGTHTVSIVSFWNILKFLKHCEGRSKSSWWFRFQNVGILRCKLTHGSVQTIVHTGHVYELRVFRVRFCAWAGGTCAWHRANMWLGRNGWTHVSTSDLWQRLVTTSLTWHSDACFQLVGPAFILILVFLGPQVHTWGALGVPGCWAWVAQQWGSAKHPRRRLAKFCSSWEHQHTHSANI